MSVKKALLITGGVLVAGTIGVTGLGLAVGQQPQPVVRPVHVAAAPVQPTAAPTTAPAPVVPTPTTEAAPAPVAAPPVAVQPVPAPIAAPAPPAAQQPAPAGPSPSDLTVAEKQGLFLGYVRSNTTTLYNATDLQLLKIADSTCQAFAAGATLTQVSTVIYQNAPVEEQNDLGTTVGAAVAAICPEYIAEVTAP